MLQTMPDQPYELAGQLRGMAHHFLSRHLLLERLLLLGLSGAAFDFFLAQAGGFEGTEPILGGHVSPLTLTATERLAELDGWRASFGWSFLARFVM